MLINPYAFGDANANAYIAAVETADGQALEAGVKSAITAFVVGCKADGIWNAIKALCILAGARTLSGALVPLVGPAPTNNNFVSADYNRKTGLIGNRSSKYLNSNRANNADAQDNQHVCFFASSAPVANALQVPIGGGSGSSYTEILYSFTAPTGIRLYSRASSSDIITSSTSTAGFVGISRSSSSGYAGRANNADATYSRASSAPSNVSLCVFAENSNGVIGYYTDMRIAFYSIGENLNLALLDSRVTTLINAIAAAIP